MGVPPTETVVPFGTETVALAPGTVTEALPLGTETVALAPGTVTEALPLGTETVALAPGNDTSALPPGTDTDALPPGTLTVAVPPGAETVTGLDPVPRDGRPESPPDAWDAAVLRASRRGRGSAARRWSSRCSLRSPVLCLRPWRRDLPIAGVEMPGKGRHLRAAACVCRPGAVALIRRAGGVLAGAMAGGLDFGAGRLRGRGACHPGRRRLVRLRV